MMRTVLERFPVIHRLGRWPIGMEPGERGSGIDRREPGVVLFAYLHHVDRPRESRLVGVGWVPTPDEHAPRGIHPGLGVAVHVLAAHDSPPVRSALAEAGENV